MTTPFPVQAPGGFVPAHALTFGAIDGVATLVDQDNPLPVTLASTLAAATVTPLTGTANASTMAGPFQPSLGRAIWLTLSGDWSGNVQLLRSEDGGATRRPLTLGGNAWGSFIGNVNEPVADESVAGATYYLAITIASGSVSYRVTQ